MEWLLHASPRDDFERAINKFALHVLPKGFMRIRYYGFLANAVRDEKLATIRSALSVKRVESEIEEAGQSFGVAQCPACGENHGHFIGLIVRWHWQPGWRFNGADKRN